MPGWLRTAVLGVGWVAGIVIAVIATQTHFDGRFVNKREHEEHELNDQREVKRIDTALQNHVDATRLDAVRLATIEAELRAIREDLRWLRENAEHSKRRVP